MNRQKALLAILLLLFGVAAITSYFRMPQQKTVATLKFVPGAVATPKSTGVPKSPDEVRLRLDLLEQQKERFTGYKRNIFMPIFHEEQKGLPVPPPPPPPKRQPPPLPIKEAQPVASVPQIAEPTPIQRDMAAFTFLGFLKKGDKKTIFLSSNKEIFLARKGDRLAGKYDVTTITDEALVITSQDGAEIIIPLVENKPLAAPGQSRPGAGR
jgi:hypothetical protein